MSFGTDALIYHGEGLNVLPITPETKVPAMPWRSWQTRPQTANEVAALIDRHPTAHIGVILGGPGACVDLETDSPAGEQHLRASTLPLPPTACWTSPRGVHRLYRASRPLPSRLGWRPGLDLLAHGRYAIAPTSTGRAWLIGLEDICALPAAWEAVLRAPRRPTDLQVVEQIGVEEGARNSILARLCGRWLTQGSSDEELARRAVAWGGRCRPPLPAAEAQTVAVKIFTARQQARSPELRAIALARSRRLRHPTWAVLIGLVGLWEDLGQSGPRFFAPARRVAEYAGVDRDSIKPALEQLTRTGLITLDVDRDPVSGRRIAVVTLPEAIVGRRTPILPLLTDRNPQDLKALRAYVPPVGH